MGANASFKRDKMRNHVFSKLGDGKNTFMWHDKWLEQGPLSSIIPMENVKQADLDCQINVADMINQDRWKWPARWSIE